MLRAGMALGSLALLSCFMAFAVVAQQCDAMDGSALDSMHARNLGTLMQLQQADSNLAIRRQNSALAAH